MPDVYEEIRSWLCTRPEWQQQAAEQLLNTGRVSDEDIQAFTAALKATEGAEPAEARAFESLGPSTASGSTMRLVEIGPISGIERLNPRNPLSFGDGNLTVIYGNNGSGKSGYTRLLKSICGKPGAVELKPNVFDAPPESRQCRITFKLDGDTREIEWAVDHAPIDDLRAVDIFDAEAARHYLTAETPSTYIPPAIAFFEQLAKVCDRVKAKLQAEQGDLRSVLPTLPKEYEGTEAGRVFQGLSASTDETAIDRLTTWIPENEQELTRTTQRLNTADPAALAQSKRGEKTQLDSLIALVRSAAAAFGDAGLASIRDLRETAQSKRRIATEAAQLNSAILEEVGSETWRALWTAARNYSQVVYADKDFPVTDEDSRCVLCHQSLDEMAKARLRDFESYVKGEVETAAAEAETAYSETLEDLPAALTAEQLTTRYQAAGLKEAEQVQELDSFWSQVRRVRKAILEEQDAPTPVVSPTAMLASLDERSQALDREVTQLEQDATHFDRPQTEARKLALEARRWMHQQVEAIRSEVTRLRNHAEYDRWLLQTNSRSISVKAGEVAVQLVTQAYVDRFNRELSALGASRIQVELIKTRTDHGKALHKLQLRGAQQGHEFPETVLSEGERRIVSLAAFLADVVNQPHSAPFVFDDPISSLDQDFEWHVATRLVDLARTRQVIVLTHRLSLYGALEDAAKKLGTEWKKHNLQQLCIETFGGFAGHPTDAAWSAKTRAANNTLLTKLDKAKKAGEADGPEAYREKAQIICSEFRKLIERTVEDDLLSEIVKRLRRGVQTDNRIGKLQHITADDCRYFDSLMTKYSCYEHSQSTETPSFIPEEPELRVDLEALRDWRDEFTKRS